MSEDNIQVSVFWKNSTVFASEHVECTIRFTNVTDSRVRASSPGLRLGNRSRDRWKDVPSVQHTRNSSRATSHIRSPSGLFRPQDAGALRPFEAKHGSTSPVIRTTPNEQNPTRHQQRFNRKDHRRSISIVSIGTDASDVREAQPAQLKKRPHPHHVRASSMQILPRNSGAPSPVPRSVSIHNTTMSPNCPGFDRTSFRSEASIKPSVRPRRMSERASLNATSPNVTHNALGLFQFPARPVETEQEGSTKLSAGQQENQINQNNTTSENANRSMATLPPSSLTKILSSASMNETPRSSGEFFSMSNNSSETLASEYPAQERSRMLPVPKHRRQGSSLGPLRVPRSETLMMGFAQVTGSFTLDASLVNQTPFEEVKKKAIIGGQGGGGLVRSQSVKKESSLLGSFGWGNIGETFGGLLAETGMSSIKEAKKAVHSKDIPILSASQSVLFVDMEILPGESKEFKFRHPIPKGSPPSHKGKAIKIQYNLVIGTQRAGKIGQQNHVKRVEVPFRVLPAIDGNGENVGHDLMIPHTLLASGASVSTADTIASESNKATKPILNGDSSQLSDDLRSYVDKLLTHAADPDSTGLLSPSEDESKNMAFAPHFASSMKDKIDLTILRGNQVSAKRSATRFEINRNGLKVAVIILPRSAYRIGESIPIVVDFQNADIASYSLHCTLEASEVVDPLIALRSKASIHRVTRKIHASQHETTVSAARVFFNLLLPAYATPTFITSGVSLQWHLRVEFVTDRADGLNDYEDDLNELMEEITKDDRGKVHAAVQALPCEVFEVSVPLRIFGAPPLADEHTEAKLQS